MKNSKLLKSVLIFGAALLSSFGMYAADITATGTVIDETGEPLIGAAVVSKDVSGVGTTTDIDGNFSIRVPEGSTLLFSYVGYVSKELKASTHMDVVMEPDNNVLDEVVVIG